MSDLPDDMNSGESHQAEEHLSSQSLPNNPPAVYVEPEVPDPFLIDDEDDPTSDNEEDVRSVADVSELQQTIVPDHEISLTSEAVPSRPAVLPSNLNKDVPPPPLSSSESDEDQTPDLYFPGLILPTMFLPIPNTDPLTALLTKYIPPEKRPVRDITGDWQHSDFHTLVITNSWRALARMARDRIVASNPENVALILDLWYLRLASLARLRLFNQTSVECTNLFVVLNGIEPPETHKYVFDRVLPFELEVMQTRLKYWSGDHMGYLDALNALLNRCRTNARSATPGDTTTVSMWKERGARICLIIASQMVEMKEYSAASKLLEPLCRQGDGISTAALRSSVARIYLQSGNVLMASKHFAIVDEDPTADQAMKNMNAALLASAEGDWTRASSILRMILKEDAENFVAINNLSVALLSQGKLKESIEVLETALKASPASVVVAEPFLFNLSTLYELRSVTAIENKRNLLIEVAKWSGDGLKTACLKMPTNS